MIVKCNSLNYDAITLEIMNQLDVLSVNENVITSFLTRWFKDLLEIGVDETDPLVGLIFDQIPIEEILDIQIKPFTGTLATISGLDGMEERVRFPNIFVEYLNDNFDHRISRVGRYSNIQTDQHGDITDRLYELQSTGYPKL